MGVVWIKIGIGIGSCMEDGKWMLDIGYWILELSIREAIPGPLPPADRCSGIY